MSEAFLGELRIWTTVFAPKSWALANGQSLPVSQNPALYALFGNKFGGDASRFNVPNLMGRVVVGVNASYPRGMTGGEPRHVLTEGEMPSHTHQLQAAKANGNAAIPGNTMFATTPSQMYHALDTARKTMNAGSLTVTGSGTSHENMMPYLSLTFCVCISGITPAPGGD